MADGADIHIDAERAERLKAAAEVAGLSPEAYALQAPDRAMDDDWAEALASLEEFDRTGQSVSAEEALEASRNNLEQRLAQRS